MQEGRKNTTRREHFKIQSNRLRDLYHGGKPPINFSNGHTMLIFKKENTNLLISSVNYMSVIKPLMNRKFRAIQPIFFAAYLSIMKPITVDSFLFLT